MRIENCTIHENRNTKGIQLTGGDLNVKLSDLKVHEVKSGNLLRRCLRYLLNWVRERL